jgi:hypothetical protein
MQGLLLPSLEQLPSSIPAANIIRICFIAFFSDCKITQKPAKLPLSPLCIYFAFAYLIRFWPIKVFNECDYSSLSSSLAYKTSGGRR